MKTSWCQKTKTKYDEWLISYYKYYVWWKEQKKLQKVWLTIQKKGIVFSCNTTIVPSSSSSISAPPLITESLCQQIDMQELKSMESKP